jgi:hypothetical protein
MKHVKLFEQFLNEAKSYSIKGMIKKATTDKTDRLPYVTLTSDVDKFIEKWAWNQDLEVIDFTPEMRAEFEDGIRAAGYDVVDGKDIEKQRVFSALMKDLKKSWDWDVKLTPHADDNYTTYYRPLIHIELKGGKAGKLENGEPIIDLKIGNKMPYYFNGTSEKFSTWLHDRRFAIIANDGKPYITELGSTRGEPSYY